MRVLYVASNPADASALNLDREITELQRRFTDGSADPVSFFFLPGLRIEELHGELMRRKPDILHLSAHGAEDALALSNEAGKAVNITAEVLKALVDYEYQPRLVYLNACNSAGLAEALAETVPMAIGSTAPITNRAARAAAVAFYERMLAGATVQSAFNAARRLLEAMEDDTASMRLCHRAEISVATEVLHRQPRLIADFKDGKAKQKGDYYTVDFGVVGCPANTTQVVFFTDDEDFIQDMDDVEDDLCSIARGIPVRGVVWSPWSWEVRGDFRIFAVGVTGDGRSYTVGSTLCEAIESRYRFAPASAVPDEIAHAIRVLRSRDGSFLDEEIAPRATRARSDAAPAGVGGTVASRRHKSKNHG
ncbi:CHAT domain-containing protein [Azospirillum argentinense]|uniref:CHAT domain-containing protein n=1 Tax=Azospirillum argentinense TaxID=2970906 RepID=A0A5B0KRW8_9PROT|nr:CHAT domain-containing protein [Azospirillum argentinense]KAA1054453.1 hypothetical protein FH063_006709 [Azospirillum argentinense]